MSAFEPVVKPTNFSAINLANDPIAVNGVGGQTRRVTAAAALNIGDVVYYTSAMKVNKSAVAATVGVPFAGVVVGGDSFDKEGRISYETLVLGSPVAASAADGDIVIIQTDGIAAVRADSAVAAGAAVIGGTTAGQIAAGTTQGSMLGTTVSDAAAGGTAVTYIKIDHR